MTTLDTTKADEIALVLEEAIVSGELEPGQVLRQEELSARFAVSRTPIREALRRLAALGLVSFVPNRGVRVRTITLDELREAFLVDGEVAGTWRFEKGRVKLEPFGRLSKSTRAELEEEAERLAAFHA